MKTLVSTVAIAVASLASSLAGASTASLTVNETDNGEAYICLYETVESDNRQALPLLPDGMDLAETVRLIEERSLGGNEPMNDFALGATAALGAAIAGSSFAEITLDNYNLIMKVTNDLENIETRDQLMKEYKNGLVTRVIKEAET